MKIVGLDIKRFTANELALLAIAISAFISIFAVLAVCIGILIYIIVTKQLKMFLERKVESAILLAFFVVSTLSSVLYGARLKLLICGIVFLGIITIKFITYAMTQRAFRAVLNVCCVMSVVCVAVALMQKIIIVTTEHGARFNSTFTNPNIYAAMIETVVLVALYCFLTASTPRKKQFYMFVFLVNVCGLFLCQSRMAFVSVIITVPIILSSANKRLVFLYLLLTVSLFAIILGLFRESLPRFFNLDEDMSLRFDIWQNAYRQFLSRPVIGQGYLHYWYHFSNYAANGHRHSHNVLLEMLMSFGLVGTGLAFSFFGINLVKLRKYTKSTQQKKRFLLAFTIVLAILIHGISDITIFSPQTGLVAVMFMLFCSRYESTGNADMCKATEQQ